jgi:hypothetical protein
VHVNPPLTVRARPASVAPGAHQGRYRPIDIDRTPFMIETRRVYGALKVHGTMTCAGKSVNLHRTLPPDQPGSESLPGMFGPFVPKPACEPLGFSGFCTARGFT